MTHVMPNRLWARIGATTAIALFGATAAPALTADELWQAWQDNRTSSGYHVTSDGAVRQGNTVVHRNVVVSGQTAAQADGTTVDTSTRISVAEISLEELSDGRVRMTLSPEILANSETTPDGSEPVSIDLKLDQEGLNTIVSGTADALAYEFEADKMTLTLVNAETDTAAEQTSPINMQMVMDKTKGEYRTTLDNDIQTQVSVLDMAQVEMTASGTDDETGALYELKATATDVSSKNNTSGPAGILDIDAALTAGANYTFDGKTGPFKLDITQSGDASDAHIAVSAAGIETAGAVNKAGLTHTARIDNQRIEMLESPDPSIPVPLSLDIAQAQTQFVLPLLKADEPQPYKTSVTLKDVTASETLWGIFDPTHVLPRDPAQLNLNISGTSRIMANFFSPEPLQNKGPMVEADTIRLNALDLSFAGMDVTAKGDATFDNTTGTAIPVGTATVKIDGINKLMQSLVDIGVIEQQQTLIAQMMLGLYAVRSGDDSYTSKIEMKASGAILANGQQIR